jgi:hypothetical protein
MPDFSQIAAAINLRVVQLEKQGVTGMALVNQMMGHMADLQVIYNTASDRDLRELCRRFPGFERYALLMEEVSEQNQTMAISGTHPYGDLPELPEPLKISLVHVLRAAADLERDFQAAADDGRGDNSGRLTTARWRWADDLEKLIYQLQSADLPLQTQALVQQIIKASAERIGRMG